MNKKEFISWAKSINARFDENLLSEKNGIIYLNGGFDCSNNQLTKLKIPESFICDGGFDCSNNQLTKLEIPESFICGGGFDCSYNQLTSIPKVNTFHKFIQ